MEENGKLKNVQLARAENLSPETREKHNLPAEGLVVVETREVPMSQEAAEKKKDLITFVFVHDQKILIKKNGVEVGHIFTPSGSGNDHEDCIQVCGFEEAFDYWGCGVCQ